MGPVRKARTFPQRCHKITSRPDPYRSAIIVLNFSSVSDPLLTSPIRQALGPSGLRTLGPLAISPHVSRPTGPLGFFGHRFSLLQIGIPMQAPNAGPKGSGCLARKASSRTLPAGPKHRHTYHSQSSRQPCLPRDKEGEKKMTEEFREGERGKEGRREGRGH